jgi:hypothetical protein
MLALRGYPVVDLEGYLSSTWHRDARTGHLVLTLKKISGAKTIRVLHAFSPKYAQFQGSQRWV